MGERQTDRQKTRGNRRLPFLPVHSVLETGWEKQKLRKEIAELSSKCVPTGSLISFLFMEEISLIVLENMVVTN